MQGQVQGREGLLGWGMGNLHRPQGGFSDGPMRMVRVWVRASRLGVCKVSTGVRHNGANAGVSMPILKLTAAQEARYVHSITVHGARAPHMPPMCST